MNRFFVPISLCVLLLLGFSIAMLLSDRHSKNNNQLVQSSPDVFMQQARYYTYTPDGQLSSILNTSTSTYNKTADTASFIKPHINSFANNQSNWDISADQGSSTKNSTIITLNGNVIFHLISNTDEPDTIITTTQAVINSKKSLAHTTKNVVIKHGTSTIRGRGMDADLKNGNYNLLSESTGYYTP